MQAIEAFLNDMEINVYKEEFYSSINVTGIFSFEKDNWLLNSVENLVELTFGLGSSYWYQQN